MRIARVLTRLNLGGPARQVLASDPLLVQQGHVVRVFAGVPEAGEGDLFETARERGIDVVRVPGLRRGVAPARDLLARRRLRQALAEFGPDVLHTHASKAGTLGRRALRQGGAFQRTARVHTFHGHVLEGYFPDVVSRRLVAHERRLARETDRVVAVSHATADDLIRLGVTREEQLVVVPPGVELAALEAVDRSAPRSTAAWRARLGLSADDVLVGVVGRLAEVKRVQLAVDVF
jgi:glycosyltransferase involved in cell wall biosynthesis